MKYKSMTDAAPMTVIYPIRVCLLLTAVLFLSSALGQTAGDRIEAIASEMRNQEYEKALQLLRPALQEFPQNAELWTIQGAAYEREGHKKDALASFNTALKIAPDYVPALQAAIQIEYE